MVFRLYQINALNLMIAYKSSNKRRNNLSKNSENSISMYRSNLNSTNTTLIQGRVPSLILLWRKY